MTKLYLRPYQEKAIDSVRDSFKQGKKRVLLHLATGGGKTLIFCHIMKSVANNGKKCVMIVRGRELVNQASERLSREGVSHGVLMAGHWKQDFNNPVQVCSVDTLRARKIIPEADLVVIDEAHLSGGSSYKDILKHYTNGGKFIVGVTATPHCKEGLRHVADNLIYPISIGGLIEQGYLVPPVYYAPMTPDLTGVKIKSSDYDEKELTERMNVITGDLVSNWQKIGENRPTICFAVSVVHSKSIQAAFAKANIKCEHVDASSPEPERKAILKRLEAGETKIVTNCGILCTGVDMPAVSCILMARPTKSYSLYIQQAGRGTRLYQGKTDFILLDHAGNIERHGFIENEKEGSLDPIEKKKKKEIEFKVPSIQTCKDCFAVFSSTAEHCPRCGLERKNKPKELMYIDGELVKISIEEQTDIHIKIYMNDLKAQAKAKGYKKGWIYYRLKDKFGEEIANKYMPKRIVPDWVWKTNEKVQQLLSHVASKPDFD
jgi:DNA repair protein RadD